MMDGTVTEQRMTGFQSRCECTDRENDDCRNDFESLNHFVVVVVVVFAITNANFMRESMISKQHRLDTFDASHVRSMLSRSMLVLHVTYFERDNMHRTCRCCLENVSKC